MLPWAEVYSAKINASSKHVNLLLFAIMALCYSVRKQNDAGLQLITYIILVGTTIMNDIFDDEAVGVFRRFPFNHHLPCTVGNQFGFHSAGVDIVCFLCMTKNRMN